MRALPRSPRRARYDARGDGPAEVDWVVLADVDRSPGSDEPVEPRRVYARVLTVTVVVLIAVAFVGGFVSRREAERESVDTAARRTEILADSVVEPALTDALAAGDPAAAAALDRVVRDTVLGDGIFRVKVWRADGTIVYSDESRLLGQRFELEGEEQEVREGGGTGAEVTDLDEPENVYERDRGKLLEVYHGVRTPDGTPLLFETYSDYDVVTERTVDIWRSFALITLGSLAALLLLLLPVVWRLLSRLQAGQEQRERLLEEALSASDAERRRIAATLHDGPVQELAATSYVVSGAAQQAAARGEADLAASLESAAVAVRSGIGGLRSLLVEVYPASLADTGLEPALADLLNGLRTRDVELRLDAPTGVSDGLDPEQTQLVFSVAQECLRNATRHGAARRVEVSLRRVRDDGRGRLLVLEVSDDGVGFDVGQAVDQPRHGHFGLRLLADAARRRGAGLRVRSAPGSGTTWRLEVPL